MDDNFILCYCVAVKKELHAETLTQALNQLILYNEMLQVRIENGSYALESAAIEQYRDKLLITYDCTGKPLAEIGALIEQIIKNMEGEMRCERGGSIRVALLNIDRDVNKLLLLLHGAVVDRRGLVLILEDLYRIYEQLSNGKMISLRPVRKTYLEFIKETVATKKTGSDDMLFGSQFTHDLSESDISITGCRTAVDVQKNAIFSLTLNKDLKRRLFSWRLTEFKLAPTDAMVGALLRSLVKAIEGSAVSICIKSDYRVADETLKYTVGTLMQAYRLPINFADERELFSNVKKLRGILRDIHLQTQPLHSPQFYASSSTERKLRLNLESLTDEPWLGGDAWLPEGFVITEKDQLRGSYSIEIIPSILSDRIEIFIEYEQEPDVSVVVDRFTASLIPELENILGYCEGYVDAKEFWVREFAKASAQTKIEVEGDGHEVIDTGRAMLRFRVEKSLINRALLNFECGDSELLLAAYSVLASRLNGSEELVIRCALDRDDVCAVFPLRLDVAWTSNFKLFVGHVKDKLRQAAALGLYGFDILSEEQPKHGRPYPVLDLGYTWKQLSENKSVEGVVSDLMAGDPPFNKEPDLALEASARTAYFDVRFGYEKSRFSAEIIARLGVYLNAILEDVAANMDVKLGEIKFETDPDVHQMASTLAEEAFNF